MVVKVYISGISGNKEVKKRQQRVVLILDSKNVKYELLDIAEPNMEEAKEYMQNNSKLSGGTISDPNPRHPLPPQIFNDDEYCGDYDAFDMANEVDEMEKFLKLSPEEITPSEIPNAVIKVENGEVPSEEKSKEPSPEKQLPKEEENESEIKENGKEEKSDEAQEESVIETKEKSPIPEKTKSPSPEKESSPVKEDTVGDNETDDQKAENIESKNDDEEKSEDRERSLETESKKKEDAKELNDPEETEKSEEA